MNKGVSYSMFYDVLLNLREDFHSYGRIDDSNAKLDEMIKLICTSYSMALKGNKFNLEHVRRVALKVYKNENHIAEALCNICDRELTCELFKNEDGTCIFGTNPTLAIQPTENDFAQRLIAEIEKIDLVQLVKSRSYSDFDIINECFGHFIRENFRNNKEDGQYMTPHEISRPVLDIIFYHMEKQNYLNGEVLDSFKVMDPTCGVGTLLIESSEHFTKYVEKTIYNPIKRENIIKQFRNSGILGQDKVDRMVRLSKINAILLGSNASNIKAGNSIVGASSLSRYVGDIDLIFTNPPFGAEYEKNELDLSYFPILSHNNLSSKTFSSELLMLDRCLQLLKSGGYLAIVLPDSFFVSKGTYSIYRDNLLKNYDILGVIGLPPVAFAQAGTRTNTCILILRNEKPSNSGRLFMADCKDLGYMVKERTGVTVKIEQGTNEMWDIVNSLTRTRCRSKILCERPSVTMIDRGDCVGNNLKPSFYSAARFKTIDILNNSISDGFAVKKLGDIVDFVTVGRKSYMVSDTIKHISVLHVNANCTIAFDEVAKFTPISKGRECFTGELIFSKINPRIPRMAVIPERGIRFVCSNEFEIMCSKGEMGMYLLCFLLKTEKVMNQIENLTAGTSSSHSRIKREQLADILIPVPVGNKEKERFAYINEQLKESVERIYLAEDIIATKSDYLNVL